MSVKRYEPFHPDISSACSVEETPDGDFVRYDDYTKLLDALLRYGRHSWPQ